jgi:HlyD family secretion protein
MKKWIKKRKWWLIGITIILAIVVVFLIRGSGEEEPLETIVIEYTTVRDEVDVTGTVQPVERYDLSFSAAGVLNSLHVAEGETVTKGQILARLDASDTALQAAQTKAVLIGDLDIAQLSLDKERNDLVDIKALNASRLEEAKQAVRNAKTSLDLTRAQFQRVTGNGDDESSATYRASESSYAAALNAHKAAQNSLSVLKKTIAQAEADARSSVTSADKTVQLKQNVINSGGDLSVNNASLQYQRALLSKSVLRAPADGIVAKIVGDIGEYVSPTGPVITIISPELYLLVNVPETEAAKLSLNDSAIVDLDTFRDEEFTAHIAKIDSIETLVSGVTTYEVTLVFSKQDKRLRSGMTADLIVLAEEKTGVLAVPQRALSGTNGQRSVSILRGEETKDVIVETGLRGGNGFIEITSGLSQGDVVVTFDPNEEE